MYGESYNNVHPYHMLLEWVVYTPNKTGLDLGKQFQLVPMLNEHMKWQFLTHR